MTMNTDWTQVLGAKLRTSSKILDIECGVLLFCDQPQRKSDIAQALGNKSLDEVKSILDSLVGKKLIDELSDYQPIILSAQQNDSKEAEYQTVCLPINLNGVERTSDTKDSELRKFLKKWVNGASEYEFFVVVGLLRESELTAGYRSQVIAILEESKHIKENSPKFCELVLKILKLICEMEFTPHIRRSKLKRALSVLLIANDKAKRALYCFHEGKSEEFVKANEWIDHAIVKAVRSGLLMQDQATEMIECGDAGVTAVDLINRPLAAVPPPENILRTSSHSLTPTPASVEGETHVFRKGTGNIWTIVFPGGKPLPLKNSLGLKYIHYLIEKQDQSISADDLFFEFDKNIRGRSSGSHEMLDLNAMREYKKEIERLEEEREGYPQSGERSEKAEEISVRLNELKKHLKKATGLRGKSRSLGGQKQYSAVRQSIVRALSEIRKQNRPLWEHFKACLRTGHQCSYKPEKPIDWQLI